MKPLPIRLRLTLWYFVMFATAAILLSLTSWWMLRRTLDATIHQDLQERIDDVRMQLRQSTSHVSIEETQAQFGAIYRYRDDGKWLQIIDQDGRWIYRSARMMALGNSLPAPQSLSHAGVVTEFVQGVRSVRAFSIPIFVDGRAYSVETGISMNKPNALLHDFGLGLLLLTPAVLLAASTGGYFMSRKALAPVAAIAHEVRRITDRNLDTRLPISPTHDELSHLSTTLNYMLARIDVGFRSVREFTANASHELRTPLARLRTEVEVALFRPRESAEYRQALERVHQDAMDMSGLIENLLTLARAETGAEVLRICPIDLQDLMGTAAKEWLSIAQRLSIHLNVSVDDDPGQRPLLVLGDRLALLRLLRILLDNACKFTSPGGSITLLANTASTDVTLAVQDSGIGIAREHQARIFDRFYRVDGDTNRNRKGTGLGLSLAAWIAEQHQTNISLESTLGHGSRFEIRLARVHSSNMAGDRVTLSTGSGVESASHPNPIAVGPD